MLFDKWLQQRKYVSNIKVKKGTLNHTSDVVFMMAPSAQIFLYGNLNLNVNAVDHNKRTTLVRMDADSKLIVKSDFSFMYDADFTVFPGATLELGNSYINSGCKIRCFEHIVIGNGCAISHDFTVLDSDAHKINEKKREGPVLIGDHVWIGTRVTVLSGVQIGDGSVIAAGAVVTHDIPPNCLAAGVPARVIKEHIVWEK